MNLNFHFLELFLNKPQIPETDETNYFIGVSHISDKRRFYG
jgi:hypothetical protein